MSAFFLFHNRRVRDARKLEQYKEAVAPIVAAYGGKYRVLGGDPAVLEGDWPSVERASSWYGSDAYRDLKAIRLEAVDSEGLLLSGLEPAR